MEMHTSSPIWTAASAGSWRCEGQNGEDVEMFTVSLQHYPSATPTSFEILGSFSDFYGPFLAQEGFRNDPEPYSFCLFKYEPITSHMEQFETKVHDFHRIENPKTTYLNFQNSRKPVLTCRECIFSKKHWNIGNETNKSVGTRPTFLARGRYLTSVCNGSIFQP